MKALKWFGLTILGIILFFSLTVFGLAFTIKQTVLNPGFVEKEINNLPLTAIVQDSDVDLAPELKDAMVKSITAIEPQLKEESGAAVKSLYDYLLGKKDNPELAQTLRNTVLSDSFMFSVVDNVDMAALLESTFREQFTNQGLPRELTPLLDQLKPILVKAEPQLKIQLKAAVPSILDYILGMSNSFSATFNLDNIVNDLKAEAKTILRNNSAFAGATDAQLNAYIEKNLSPQLNEVNTSITIDQTTLGTGAQLTDSLREAEDSLAQVRPYILMFQTYYIWLIVLIVLVIAGIAAIHHSVRGATRSLGITFLVYGVVEFVPLIIIKLWAAPNYIYPELEANTPAYLQTYVRQAMSDSMSPLWWFSLGCLIAGVALLVVSFVYRPAKKENPVSSTTTGQIQS